MICALDNKPEIREEIQNLADKIGYDYDTTRVIYENNNGYSLDKAPNGAESKLYKSLLEYYNGNEVLALKAKAKTYLAPFFNWFGDWTVDDKTNVSKVVDENGEPLIVYHGTTAEFNEFDMGFRGATDPGDRGLGFYFSPRRDYSGMYGNIIIPSYINIKNPVPENLFKKIDAFGRDKAKRLSLYEKLTNDIKTREFTIEGLEEKLYGNIPEHAIYREEPSRSFILMDLKQEKLKLADLKSQLATKTNEELDLDLNAQWNSDVSTINKFDGVIPNISKPYESIELVVAKPNQIKSIDNDGNFSTVDNNIYHYPLIGSESNSFNTIRLISEDVIQSFMSSVETEEYKANTFLTRMINSGEFFNDKAQSKIASQLEKILGKEVSIMFTNDATFAAKYEIKSGKSIITINIKAFHTMNTYDFGHMYLHELVHHFTIREYKNNSAFKTKIDSIVADIKGKCTDEELSDKLFYGLKNGEEFITELFTNAAFREMVVKRKSVKGWRRILAAVLNALGFKTKALNIIEAKAEADISSLVNEISNIINNYYSNPNNCHLGDAVAYLNPSDPMYDQISKKAKEIVQKANKGLNSRLQALKRSENTTPQQIIKLQNQVEYYEALYQKGEMQQIVVDFVKQCSVVYKDALYQIRKTYLDDDTMTNDEAWTFKGDFLDFYGPLVLDISQALNGINYFDNYTIEELKKINRRLQLIQNAHAEIYGKWQHIVLRKTKQLITELCLAYGVPQKEIDNYISKYFDDPLNITERDMGFYGRYLLSTKSMDDLAIRTMHRIMVDINNEVTRFSNNKAQEVIRALLPIKKYWKYFYERSEVDDKKTGNLVRPLNYGQFNNDYQNFLKRLDKKYDVINSEYKLLEDDKYIDYCVEKEAWLANHCERKFLPEYYKAYAKLPLMAKESLKSFNREITFVTSKVTDENGIHLEQLSDEDYAKLRSLYKLKRNLSNFYYEDGEKKAGLDLEIAEALHEFEETTRGGIISVELTQEEIKNIIEEKKTKLSKEEFSKWYSRNIAISHSQELMDTIKLISGDFHSAKYKALQEERNALLRYGRNSSNPYVTAKNLTKAAKERIVELSNMMEALDEKSSRGVKITDFVEFVPTEEYKIDKAAAESKGLDSYKEWYTNNHTSKGRIAPYYTKMVPKNSRQMVLKLNDMNREMSPESPLINPAYDFNNSEYYQPKASFYHNPLYDLIVNLGLKSAYDYVISVMDESNKKIGYLNNADNYKLPQISGDFIDHVIRSKEHFKGLGEYVNDQTSIRKDDEQYALDNFVTRADGTLLDFVPTPYIKRLNNSDTISSNLIGLLVEYSQMAENYRLKNKHKGDFMLLDEALKGRNYIQRNVGSLTDSVIRGKDTRTYEKYHEFLDMLLWGRYKAVNSLIGNIDPKKQERITKTAHITKKWATSLNLSWNAFTIVKSFMQGLNKSIVESIAGRYITADQYFKFMAQEILLLPKHLFQLGNVQNNDLTFALLKHNGISKEVKDTIQDLQYSRAVRVVTKNKIWGGWSLIDYVIKSPVLKSVYSNAKYDPNSGKFLLRHQFINKYYPEDRNKGKKEFRNLKIRAIDIIDVKDGVLTVKKQYEHLHNALFNGETQNVIKNVAKFLTNQIDGALSPEDKTRIMTDAFGSWVFMHRSFFVNNFENNYATNYQYNPLIEDYQEAKFLSFTNPMIDLASNLWTFGVNNIRKLTGNNTRKEYKHVKFDSVRRYNVSKIALLWGFVILISMLAAIWWNEKAKDSDSVAAQTLEAAMEGMVNEEIAEYPSKAFFNQVSSISPGFSPISNIHNLIQSFSFEENWDSYNTYESGVYEDMTPGVRNVIRIIPGVKGFWESLDVKSRWNFVLKNRTWPVKEMYFDEYDEED